MSSGQAIKDEERILIRDLYPALRSFARVVAPVEVEPEDLVQECLYRALRGGPLTRLEHPAAYLRRSIVNLASNHRRQLGRLRRAASRLTADPHNDAYTSDVAELLRLAPRARAVMYLRAIEGLPYGEIASVLGCRESTARSTATRAARQLRGFLTTEEVDRATA